MAPFILTDDIASLQIEDARVLEVPAQLTHKQALLSWYAQALTFPEYFGANWDALDECLRDLSWIDERAVVLYHRALPLEASPKDQKIYIDVLLRATQDWGPDEAHQVVAAFDPACELRLQALVQGAEISRQPAQS